MTTAINLNALLKQTIVLTRENEEWSTEQIIAELMSNHVEIQSLAPISVAAPEKRNPAPALLPRSLVLSPKTKPVAALARFTRRSTSKATFSR